MLTVRLAPHAVKSVTLHYTLETFSFCSAYYFDFIAFRENVGIISFANANAGSTRT